MACFLAVIPASIIVIVNRVALDPSLVVTFTFLVWTNPPASMIRLLFVVPAILIVIVIPR